MKSVMTNLAMTLLCFGLFAQDEGAVCRNGGKVYNSDGQFLASDFVAGGSGLLFGSTIHPDFGGAIDLDNIVFPSDQAFYVDYIGEGAGASHLFGFFFLDIDTNKNGIPNFFEINPTDDMDGDGIPNSLDDDDDGDGILDVDDTLANAGSEVTGSGYTKRIAVTQGMPASYFRNGQNAADAGTKGDFWKWIPSNAIQYNGKWIFAHPGAFLYVDNNGTEVPDILEAPSGTDGTTSMPAYVVDKDHDRNASHVHYQDQQFPALLGNWNVTVGAENRVFWLGSTIFKLADDDGDSSAYGSYNTYSPYDVRDISSSLNAQPDYWIYGTSDGTSPLIPDLVKAKDNQGQWLWKYRWYEGDISGGRELIFFLTVFYPSGSRAVNTYYSKAAFNPDPGSSSYTPNSPGTSGDQFGNNGSPAGTPTSDNWFPSYQNNWHHNKVAQYAFGKNWSTIATQPTDGSRPVALPGYESYQDWIDEWQNYSDTDTIIQYIALKNWLDSAGGNEFVVKARYGIDLETETDNSVIRKSNKNMNHMMVGAPKAEKEAWLLGWEDLFNGGDRDFEDVVFYVKREARGSAQTQNIASDLRSFEDTTITTIEFEFQDNFTASQWGVEGNYINYYYRLAATDEWIPLLGGEHLGTPNVFTETTEEGGLVTRHVIIQLANEGSRELYWKVEMNSNDVSVFEPEVHHASADYKAMIHEVFYNGGEVASSDVDYYGAYETPSVTWLDKNANRGHFYARKTFIHGNPPVLITTTNNPEDYLTQAPPYPWLWDTGYSMLSQVTADSSMRNIYTFTTNATGDFSSANNITEHVFKAGMDDEVRLALNLSSQRVDGVIKDNFQDPAGDFNLDQASDWLAAWVHGQNGIVGGTPGYKREWILGGLNRASPAIIRPPGVPYWINGRSIKASVKNSYWDYMDANRDTPTRALIGSEAGLLHLINAGTWVGKRKNPDDLWMDGHYSDYGDGTEKWAMIPSNLLDDLKNNYHGGSIAAAKIDGTAITTSILSGGEWKRIALVTQGENGGEHNNKFGDYVWAMDISDVDNKPPKILWERTADNFNQILGIVALGWLKQDESGATYNDEGVWIGVYTSGAAPVKNGDGSYQAGSFDIVDAYSGRLMKRVALNAGEVMAGTPALVDADQDGYSDWLFGATSFGRVIAFSLNDFHTLVSRDYSSYGRFFLSPNVNYFSDTEVNFVTVTGDNPLVIDESLGPANNSVLSLRFNTEDLDFTLIASFRLPAGHKAFSRPLLMGDALFLATTTGETSDYCDFNPDDPGNWYLFRNIVDFSDNDYIPNVGTTKAPITGGGALHAHISFFENNQDWNSVKAPGGVNLPDYGEQPQFLNANFFAPFGYEEVNIGESY